MYLQEGRRNSRNGSLAVDLLHIGLGIVIVALAVVLFLAPEEHLSLFPAIFFLAGLLNFINGICKFKLRLRQKMRKGAGLLEFLLGLLLFALAGVSGFSIWWR